MHSPALHAGGHQPLDFAEERIGGHRLQLRIGGPGKTQSILHNTFEARDFGIDDACVLECGGRFCRCFSSV
jgi:hypothetical protein